MQRQDSMKTKENLHDSKGRFHDRKTRQDSRRLRQRHKEKMNLNIHMALQSECRIHVLALFSYVVCILFTLENSCMCCGGVMLFFPLC